MNARNATARHPRRERAGTENNRSSQGSEASGETSLRWRWRLGLAAAEKAELSSVQKLVAHTLALHMERDGENCYPGLEMLAEETSLARSTVVGAIEALEVRGWIRVARGRGRSNTHVYEPTLPTGKRPGAGRFHEDEKRSGSHPENVRLGSVKRPGAGPEEDREDDTEYATAVAHVREAAGGGAFHACLARLPSAPRSGAQVEHVRRAWEARPEGVERIVGEILKLPDVVNPFGLLVTKVGNEEHLHEQREPPRIYTRTAHPEGTCEGCGQTAALIDACGLRCATCTTDGQGVPL